MHLKYKNAIKLYTLNLHYTYINFTRYKYENKMLDKFVEQNGYTNSFVRVKSWSINLIENTYKIFSLCRKLKNKTYLFYAYYLRIYDPCVLVVKLLRVPCCWFIFLETVNAGESFPIEDNVRRERKHKQVNECELCLNFKDDYQVV